LVYQEIEVIATQRITAGQDELRQRIAESCDLLE
jgi:hypothetical protein